VTTIRVLLLATLVAGAGASAAAAREEDTCATGDAELADERAIAAVRAAIDVACPCPTFAGKDRAAYQRCARRALRDALAAGTVRVECKRLLTTVARGATCGGRAIACGHAASDGTPSCRVQATSRCKARRETQATACDERFRPLLAAPATPRLLVDRVP